jgi:lambda family phage portal protein
LQATITAAVVRDGECFVQLIHATNPTDKPLELKLLEADMVPLEHNSFAANGNRIIAGIEYDDNGKKTAYHLHKFHPGEMQSSTNYAWGLVRIESEQILHIFHSERPGQQRGISWLTPILVELKTLGDFNDSVLERQRLQNLYMGVITKPAPLAGQENIDPLTGQMIETAANGAAMISMEPGAMVELAPGEDMKFSAPPDAGNNYSEYVKTRLQNIASGVGLPFISLSGDVENLSDRSLRVVIQDFRRQVEAHQFNLIIGQFLRPVYKAWLYWSVMTGSLLPSEAKKASLCEFAPPRFKYYHPVQDVQSLKAEVEAGFRSRSSVIAELGNDPDMVDSERASDALREERLNLTTIEEKKTRADIALTWAQTDATRTAKITTAAKQNAQPATNAQALKIENAQLELALSESQTAKFNLEAAKFKLEDVKLEVEASKLGLEELRKG